jgi:hypothetical protein
MRERRKNFRVKWNSPTGLLTQRTTAGRLFGLDAGDWSMLLLGLALACVLLVLI